MSKLTAEDNNENKQFKPRIYQREDNQEIIMIKVIMMRVMIRIGIGQIVETEWHHLMVEVSMDSIIGEDYITLIIIEMTIIIEETILEKHKTIEVRILEVILEGVIEIVIVGLDQVQELVLIETGSDALSVGNMIILLKNVKICRQKMSQNKYNKCII